MSCQSSRLVTKSGLHPFRLRGSSGLVASQALTTATDLSGLQAVTFNDLLKAWESLLRDGVAMLGETMFEVRGREIVEVF